MYDYNFTFKLSIENDALEKSVSAAKKRIKELEKLRETLFKQ